MDFIPVEHDMSKTLAKEIVQTEDTHFGLHAEQYTWTFISSS